MSKFRATIEVGGVPVRAAYDQLTHFENYPRFMTGVQQVVRIELEFGRGQLQPTFVAIAASYWYISAVLTLFCSPNNWW